MTPYEIQVPLIALGIAVCGVVYVKWLSWRLDREYERERAEWDRKRAAESGAE